MAEITKRITADDRLKLLGLWTLCTDHYGKAREFERAIGRMIGQDYFDSGIGDSVYASDGPYHAHHFDEALLMAGIGIEDDN